MIPVSIFLVTVIKIFIDYAKELKLQNVSNEIVIRYTIYPALILSIFFFFKLIDNKNLKKNEFFAYLNKLTIWNFFFIALFISILISQVFWYKIGLLIPLIYISLGLLLVSCFIIFLSLLILLFLLAINKS